MGPAVFLNSWFPHLRPTLGRLLPPLAGLCRVLPGHPAKRLPPIARPCRTGPSQSPRTICLALPGCARPGSAFPLHTASPAQVPGKLGGQGSTGSRALLGSPESCPVFYIAMWNSAATRWRHPLAAARGYRGYFCRNSFDNNNLFELSLDFPLNFPGLPGSLPWWS
jgi:hypothetical protein